MLDFTELRAYRAMLNLARSPKEAVEMEQMRAITQNIVPLYFLISASAVGLGGNFYGQAPDIMTVGVPLVAVLVSLWRVTKWWGAEKRLAEPDNARRNLRQLEGFTIILFAMLAVWVAMFLPYSSDIQVTYLSFFTAFTGAAATLCALSRPRMVAITLSLTLLQFCVMFMGQAPRYYLFTAIQLAATYFVFFLASRSYNRRLIQGVMLHYQLKNESARTARLSETNRQLALSDTLTGLPNRRSFFEEIDRVIGECGPDCLPVVGLIDLDGFKPINDVYGHAAGDAVLVETATRLTRVIGSENRVARLGGDEFAYILPPETSPEAARLIAERVVNVFLRPFRLPTNDTSRVSASVGYSSRVLNARTSRDLVAQADFALFRAKEVSVGHAVEFSAEHAKTQQREALVQQCFRSADLEEEIRLVFQPIVDSSTGTVVRFEALARWTHPEIGIVGPDEFVAVAEKAGMTHLMTRSVFRKAIRQLREWPDSVQLTVNLSAQDIISRDTTEELVSMLMAEEPSLCERLCLEVTETSLLSDTAEARYNLERFRQLGLKIALDDFGTGYSSLRYLQDFDFDVVKIDRTFIQSQDVRAHGFGLVATIQQLCRSMAIDCVVEGVETFEQLQYARSAGCRYIQGYFYSRPLEADAASAYFPGAGGFTPFSGLARTGGRNVA